MTNQDEVVLRWLAEKHHRFVEPRAPQLPSVRRLIERGYALKVGPVKYTATTEGRLLAANLKGAEETKCPTCLGRGTIRAVDLRSGGGT